MKIASDELLSIKNECDNYRQTVEALITFVNTATWDHKNNKPLRKRQFSFGRKFETTSQNEISPGNVVTPDLAVERSSQNGVIAEVKKTLPENKELNAKKRIWDDHIVVQLKKYDDDLKGWFTQNSVKDVDIVFITDLTLCVRVKEFIIDERRVSFAPRKFAIIGFERSSNNEECITFKLEHGELTDKDFLRKLQLCDKVSIDKAMRSLDVDYKFYDARPPTPLLTHVFWTYVLFTKQEIAQIHAKYRCKTVDISVDEATHELQKYYGSVGGAQREQEFPRKDWIKEAFEFLKKIGLAKLNDTTAQNYTFLLKKIARKEDIEEYFCRKWLDVKDKKVKGKMPEQPTLFDRDT